MEPINFNSKEVYDTINIQENKELFQGFLRIAGTEYLFEESLLENLCTKVGFPKTLNALMKKNNPSLWVENILGLYHHFYGESLTVLLRDNEVIGFTTKSRKPLLHREFASLVNQVFSDYEDSLVLVSSALREDPCTQSEVLLMKKDTLSSGGNTYSLGFLLLNDELDTVSCRLVLRVDGTYYYLPTSACNLSAARYNRSTEDATEACRMLFLRLLEDLLSEDWYSRMIPEFVNHVSVCKSSPITYEECKRASRILRSEALRSDIDESEYEDLLDNFEAVIEDFESSYPLIEEKQSSYLWRCTAVGMKTMWDLINSVEEQCEQFQFYPESISEIRRLLGEFLILDKISNVLAKRRS